MGRFGLGAALFVIWLLLSGYFEPLLLGLGLLSSVLVVTMVARMGLLNAHWQPRMGWRMLAYLPWLVGEVVKSNWDVAKLVIDPKLSISPCIVRLPSMARTEQGNALYANSITLTPGTVTLAVDDEGFEVHALTEEAAEALREGEMARRVAAVETGS